jgi:hypothetical protein
MPRVFASWKSSFHKMKCLISPQVAGGEESAKPFSAYFIISIQHSIALFVYFINEKSEEKLDKMHLDFTDEMCYNGSRKTFCCQPKGGFR